MDAYLIAAMIVAGCSVLSVLIWRSNQRYDRSKDVMRGGWGRLFFGAFLAVIVYLVAGSLEITAKQVFVVSGSAVALLGSWVIAGFLNEKWR